MGRHRHPMATRPHNRLRSRDPSRRRLSDSPSGLSRNRNRNHQMPPFRLGPDPIAPMRWSRRKPGRLNQNRKSSLQHPSRPQAPRPPLPGILCRPRPPRLVSRRCSSMRWRCRASSRQRRHSGHRRETPRRRRHRPHLRPRSARWGESASASRPILGCGHHHFPMQLVNAWKCRTSAPIPMGHLCSQR